MGNGAAGAVLYICDSANFINIVNDLDFLLVIDVLSLAVTVRNTESQRVLAVDFACDNNVIGIFQNRFPRAIAVQNHRSGIADLLIGSLWNVVEPNIHQFWSFGGVRSGERNLKADIVSVGRLQLSVRADHDPVAPISEVITGGGFHGCNGGDSRCVLTGDGHLTRAGKIAVSSFRINYTAFRVDAISGFQRDTACIGKGIHIGRTVCTVAEDGCFEKVHQIICGQWRITVKEPVIKAACIPIGVRMHSPDEVCHTATIQLSGKGQYA